MEGEGGEGGDEGEGSKGGREVKVEMKRDRRKGKGRRG